jgi:hypothetical protein
MDCSVNRAGAGANPRRDNPVRRLGRDKTSCCPLRLNLACGRGQISTRVLPLIRQDGALRKQ